MIEAYIVRCKLKDIFDDVKYYGAELNDNHSLTIQEVNEDTNLFLIETITDDFLVILKLKGIRYTTIALPDNFYFYIEEEYLPLALYESEYENISNLFNDEI